MGEPAIDLTASANKPTQQQVLKSEQLLALIQQLNKVSNENVTALNGLIGDVPPNSANMIGGRLKRDIDKVGMIVTILKMKDPLEGYNKHITKGNRLMAVKSMADLTQAVLKVTETGLKSNIDFAMLLVKRDPEYIGMVPKLKRISEKIGYLGRAASAFGVISGTLAMIDAIREGKTEAALQAGVSIAESLGALISPTSPLGIALSAPIKMVLVFGQVGGMLRHIRNQAIQDKTRALIKQGDRVFAIAKVADTYRTDFFTGLGDGRSPEELKDIAILQRDWARQTAEGVSNLMQGMADMEYYLQHTIGRKHTVAFNKRLNDRINMAADSIVKDRRRGRPVMSGEELLTDWSIVQAVLDSTAEFVAVRFQESGSLKETQIKLYAQTMRNGWNLLRSR